MCGIAGIWGGEMSREARLARLQAMTDLQRHRGPDNHGHWHDPICELALGHRRLSIIDLSDQGAQPMLSQSGRYAMSYNGELYNFKTLRSELATKGVRFRGASDSEVLIEAFDAWGLDAVSRLNGMFAIALWDRETQCLSLFRDRLGIKPLYYGAQDGVRYFFSDPIAVRALDERPAVDRHALCEYFRYGYIPAPLCIYEKFFKVEAGTVVHLRSAQEPRVERYWRAPSPTSARGEYVPDEFETLLLSAVESQMVSDVPVGAFLSGGIDSTAVVAAMCQVSSNVKTFSVGFAEKDFDESSNAEAVAKQLGTDHHCIRLNAQDLMAVVPDIADIYAEPFADSSQIPTYLLSKFTRSKVTVALSGDGGDEVFGGYNRYVWAPRLWSKLSRVPLPLRRIAARTSDAVLGTGQLHRLDALINPEWLRQPNEKLEKVATIVDAKSEQDLFHRLTFLWPSGAAAVLGTNDRPLQNYSPDHDGDFVDWMTRQDISNYLPEDILTKVDRASMRESLEVRVPLLDHEVVEYGLRLRTEEKIHGGKTKVPLRDFVSKYVRPDSHTQAKSGFGVPIRHWLRHELREWVSDMLSPSRLRRENYLRPEAIESALHGLEAGRPTHHRIWTALMFEAWLDRRA